MLDCFAVDNVNNIMMYNLYICIFNCDEIYDPLGKLERALVRAHTFAAATLWH